MSDNKEHPKSTTTEPPGAGDSVEDAAREAVEEIERSGNPHAGTGDAG